MNHKKILLEILECIKENGPENIDNGICSSMGHYQNYPVSMADEKIIDSIMDSIFKDWKHFSGSYAYPIPSTTAGVSHSSQFHLTDHKWDKTTEYGRLRWDLLEFMISEIEILVDSKTTL